MAVQDEDVLSWGYDLANKVVMWLADPNTRNNSLTLSDDDALMT